MAYRSSSPLTPPRRPVVITGAGLLSPLGTNLTENAEGFLAGRQSFRPVTLFDTSRQRVHTAGQANLPDTPPTANIPFRAWQRMDRGTRMACLAAHEALLHAKLPHGGHLPTFIGTSAGAMPLGEAYYLQATRSDSRRGQFTRVESYQPSRQLSHLQHLLHLSGPLRIISNACASGANAIGHAFHAVSSGKAEAALAGGYDALCQLVFAGFDSLQALATSGIPRPFDAHRDGLALGEGAGFLVIESLDSANRRQAPILAHLLSYAAATDTHHLTQPHPQGDTALLTMSAATSAAGLEPGQIDYINSHGTGTPLNDVAEAHAITRWAGPAAAAIAVSSTKSAIGHLLGGAGAVETIICLLALQHQFLPANLNLRTPDPAVTFDLVTQPRHATLRTTLTNSFGFGGANATLILQREPWT